MVGSDVPHVLELRVYFTHAERYDGAQHGLNHARVGRNIGCQPLSDAPAEAAREFVQQGGALRLRRMCGESRVPGAPGDLRGCVLNADRA